MTTLNALLNNIPVMVMMPPEAMTFCKRSAKLFTQSELYEVIKV